MPNLQCWKGVDGVFPANGRVYFIRAVDDPNDNHIAPVLDHPAIFNFLKLFFDLFYVANRT